MVKICLCAIGIMIGLFIPLKDRKKASVFALIAFVITYIPLVMGFAEVIKKNRYKEQ